MTNNKINELKYAIVQTVPVMLGYVFLGIAFGLLLNNIGYNYIWAFFISLFVYAGSMEFLMVSLISGGVGLLYSSIMTVFVNGRHIFYGLPFIEKFKKMGNRYPYMIFSLTDETFSVLCNLKVKDDMNEENVMFYISILDHLYWLTGSVLGGLIGKLIKFNTEGIDFSMTALFVVIVVNQWRENNNHFPAIVGLISSLACLLIFGPSNFLLPSLIISSVVLIGGKKLC